MDNYTKVKLEGTYKCASGEEQKDVVKKKYGTVVVYKENATDEQGLAYFKDKDNKIYNACSLPKAYQTDGLKIIFSGIVYYPNPAANTYNPLSGLEFEITELWINK